MFTLDPSNNQVEYYIRRTVTVTPGVASDLSSTRYKEHLYYGITTIVHSSFVALQIYSSGKSLRSFENGVDMKIVNEFSSPALIQI